jgi:hypothetical protein
MSCSIHLAFSLVKKNAGDLALFHQMIGDIYWKKWRIFGDVVSVKCWYTILAMGDEKSGLRTSSPIFFEHHMLLVEAM